MSSQNASDARFGLVLSSRWARDVETARAAVEEVEADPFAGHFKDGMSSLARAGVAALDGASAAAVAEYRAAIASFDRTGARFLAALTQLDALMLLPGEAAIADWADAARERFEIVKSPALLERLDEAVAVGVAWPTIAQLAARCRFFAMAEQTRRSGRLGGAMGRRCSAGGPPPTLDGA